jgi:SH3 domain protein
MEKRTTILGFTMRKFIFALVFIVVAGVAGLAAAKTVYVTDSFEITMRTGPGNGNKIIAMLSSGTPLQVVDEKDGWSQVQTTSGKEGWVLDRFVTPDLPKKTVIERLQSQNERLRKTAEEATTRAKELGSQNKELSTSLAGREGELSKIKDQYSSLQSDAQNVVDLKTRYDAATTQLKKITAEKRAVAEENQELRSGVRMQWFLTGAGVVGGSWLIGFIMGRVRRRNKRSSLY